MLGSAMIAAAIIFVPILMFVFNSLLQNKQHDHDVGLLNAQLEFQQQMKMQDKMEKLQADQQRRRQGMAERAQIMGMISQLEEVFGHVRNQPEPGKSQDWRDEREVEAEGAGAHGG